ncbi:MAG TPA: phosphoribosyltransferase [Streptosporangiaceae bacterium]
MLDEAREGRPAALAGWPRLHAVLAAQGLFGHRPWLSAPGPGLGPDPDLGSGGPAGLCGVCRGPAAPGRRLCFQCTLHRECAGPGLAALVVPVAFAIKGSPFAAYLWQYKSARPPPAVRDRAGVLLSALLLLFLREHGRCLWRAAGTGAPTALAVVPTGRGRAGPHPLRGLVQDYLDLPWAELEAGPGRDRERDLDPARYVAAVRPGARVLLLDDTWTTGASAQSAAMALHQAGALAVVTVVLGRHVSPAAAQSAGLTPAVRPYRPGWCAVHTPPGPAPLSRADLRLDP